MRSWRAVVNKWVSLFILIIAGAAVWAPPPAGAQNDQLPDNRLSACLELLAADDFADLADFLHRAPPDFWSSLAAIHGVDLLPEKTLARALSLMVAERAEHLRTSLARNNLEAQLYNLIGGLRGLSPTKRPKSLEAMVSKTDHVLRAMADELPSGFELLSESDLARRFIVAAFLRELKTDPDRRANRVLFDHFKDELDFWLMTGSWPPSATETFVEFVESRLSLANSERSVFFRDLLNFIAKTYVARGGPIEAPDLEVSLDTVASFVLSQERHSGPVRAFLVGYLLAVTTEFQPRTGSFLRKALLQRVVPMELAPSQQTVEGQVGGSHAGDGGQERRKRQGEPFAAAVSSDSTPSRGSSAPIQAEPATEDASGTVVLPKGFEETLKHLAPAVRARVSEFLEQARKGPGPLELFLRARQSSWQLRRIIYLRREVSVARLSGKYVIGFEVDTGRKEVRIIEISKTFGRAGESR